MELIRGLHNLPRVSQKLARSSCALTIGNFDGVHAGHRQLIAQLRRRADEERLPAWLMFFEPQPQEYFDPESAPHRLTGFRSKVELLSRETLDGLVCLNFNRFLAGLTAEVFVRDILVKQMHVRLLIIGDDFCLGAGRKGDFDFLQTQGQLHGFRVERVDTFVEGEERASSTRVRKALLQADFPQAQNLLERPYSITGRVVSGRALGRTLGAPTANIAMTGKAPPLSGVYVVEVKVPGQSQLQPGVANLGYKPTLAGEQALLLEVHLINFSGDLYGQQLNVYFRHKIRDEQSFANIDSLKVQIHQDIQTARHFFQTITASQ